MNRQWETGTVVSGRRVSRLHSAFRRFLLPLLSLVALALFGCATGSEMESTKSDLAQVQVQSAKRDRDIAQMKEQIASMSKDLNTLTAIRESQSTLLAQVNDYSKELQSLRGRFDENKYFIDKTIKDLTSELDLEKARTAALENELKSTKTPTPARESTKAVDQGAEKEAPVVNTESAPKGPDDAAKLYDDAHIALKGKKYAEARKTFERFVQRYPKEALTPNAYFWIGESYYSEKKYEDAILAYEDFLKKYPNHEKARGAMLKQGFSFLELGDKKTGKVILETLVEKYPKSKEAELAQKRLKDLSKTTSTPKSKKK